MKKLLSLLLFFFFVRTLSAQDFEGAKKINGTSLYFKIIGKGDPIVIIHGGPGMNHSYLMPHLKDLSKKYRLVFYDQRASGKSATPSPDSISLKFFTDDLEAIRKDLGVEKLNLLSHSWGALPAVAYGIQYPDKVNKMILCNPTPLSREFDKEMLENQKKKASGKDSTDRSIIIGSKGFRSGEPDAYKKLLILTFRHSFYDPKNYSKLQLDLPANYRAASQALMTGLGKEMEGYNFIEGVKTFSFPVLILHGAADAIPLGASTLAQSKMQKASLQVFNKSGHFIFIDQPGRFNSAVNSFLSNR